VARHEKPENATISGDKENFYNTIAQENYCRRRLSEVLEVVNLWPQASYGIYNETLSHDTGHWTGEHWH